MAAAKYDVKKFTSTNDFELWRMKMKALLVHQGMYEALLRESLFLIRCLIKTRKRLLQRLIVLYLKQAMYSFKMIEDKSIGENIDEFNKLILDRENIGVTIEDEDQAFLLFSSLSKSFVYFKDTMLYGRESITLDDV
ncbi:hypothetical protein CsatB_019612 [Cannabis sativa]